MIVDTNALSAVADGDPAAVAALAGTRITVPVIVLGEFRFGIAQSRRAREYAQWLAGVLAGFEIAPVVEQTTLYYAQIRLELKRTGTPIPSNDVWIAALCRQHDLPLLSRDRHFDVVNGLRRHSW